MAAAIPYVFFTGFVAQILAMTMYRPEPPTTRRWLGLDLNRLPRRSDYLAPIGWWSQLTAFAAVAATIVLGAAALLFNAR